MSTNSIAATPPTALNSPEFVDRRTNNESGAPVGERRQFTNSHSELTPGARELAQAIDTYKLQHRRRFITYEEIFNVICDLGYEKNDR